MEERKRMIEMMDEYVKWYAEQEIEKVCEYYGLKKEEVMKKIREEEAGLEGKNELKEEAGLEAKLETKLEEKKEAKKEEKKEEKKKGRKKKEEKKEEKLEMEIELPFSGEIDERRCKGIRTAGKLYTQCLYYVEGERYCKKCKKESEKNESGKPNNGDITERAEKGLYEYKDKDGKNPWAYYKLMRKHNWSREYVEEIGKKYGIRISEEHYNEEEMKKKVHQKGKKGRPKKEEKEVKVEAKVEGKVEEELKEEIVIIEKELEKEEALEEEEEEEEIVEEIEYEGKEYLRSKSSGLIYSKENLEDPIVLGIWDRIKKRINFEYVEDVSSDLDEE